MHAHTMYARIHTRQRRRRHALFGFPARCSGSPLQPSAQKYLFAQPLSFATFFERRRKGSGCTYTRRPRQSRLGSAPRSSRPRAPSRRRARTCRGPGNEPMICHMRSTLISPRQSQRLPSIQTTCGSSGHRPGRAWDSTGRAIQPQYFPAASRGWVGAG